MKMLSSMYPSLCLWRERIEMQKSISSDDDDDVMNNTLTKFINPESSTTTDQKIIKSEKNQSLSEPESESEQQKSKKVLFANIEKIKQKKLYFNISHSDILEGYNNNNNDNNLFKIIFIGDSMVGKSSFIHRATKGFFPDRTSSTIGIDFRKRFIRMRDRIFELQLWDTAGQERFRTITMNYFRKVDAICLMYDVTRERTFTNVRFWINSIQESMCDAAGTILPLLVLGNKIDYRNETITGGCNTLTKTNIISITRQQSTSTYIKCVPTCVGEKMVQDLAMGPLCRFMETSCKSGHNVEEALLELTKMIIWSSFIISKRTGSLNHTNKEDNYYNNNNNIVKLQQHTDKNKITTTKAKCCKV